MWNPRIIYALQCFISSHFALSQHQWSHACALNWVDFVFFTHRQTTPTRFSFSPFFHLFLHIILTLSFDTQGLIQYCNVVWIEREREFIWQLLLICKEISIVAIALESLARASQSHHHNCYYWIKWQLSLIPFFRSFPLLSSYLLHRACSIAFTWLLFNCFNSIFHFDYMLALYDSATLHSVLWRCFFLFSCNLFDWARTAC